MARRRTALTRRDRYLRQKFGITEAQYMRMFKAQGKVCAICLKPPKGRKSLAVDHDHKTKRIRGLLCFNCNKYRIGRNVDPAPFYRAGDYLSRKVALGL